jgi:hypothetical protein
MITMWHTRHLDMLFSLMTRLLDDDKWFDVRVIVPAELWSITFNDDFKIPPRLARFLEEPPRDHHPAKALPMNPRPKTVAEAKAMRKKERKR